MNYLEEFNKIFKEVIGVEPDETLAINNVAGWDSLKQVQLIFEMQDRLDLDFEFDEVIVMTSVKKIKDILAGYQK